MISLGSSSLQLSTGSYCFVSIALLNVTVSCLCGAPNAYYLFHPFILKQAMGMIEEDVHVYGNLCCLITRRFHQDTKETCELGLECSFVCLFLGRRNVIPITKI